MIKVIHNKINGETTLNISAAIGETILENGEKVKGVNLNDLMQTIQNDTPEKIKMNVSTLGGDLFEALSIHDYLKALGKPITCNIIGSTASAGTVIAMAADVVNISENSRFLIHRASGEAQGNAEDMSDRAKQLMSFDNTIAEFYSKKTGQNTDFIKDLMKQDRWLSASEAVEFKFCNSILKTISNIKKISNMDEEQIKALQAENEALKAKVAELEGKLAENTSALENIEKATIENEIQAAIEAGKIEDTEKEVYQNFGKGNVKALSEKFKMMKPKNRVFVQPTNVTVTAEMDWDYFHKKNPKQLAQLKASDRKTFNSLYFAKFGKYPTEGK